MKIKFKVGDKVRVVSDSTQWYSVGDRGVVDTLDADGGCWVEFEPSPIVMDVGDADRRWRVPLKCLALVDESMVHRLDRIATDGHRFMVEDKWEVSFLYNKPITVCVIRNVHNLMRAGGIAVCNPNDVWDMATGRHKAMDSVFYNLSRLVGHGIEKDSWLNMLNAEGKIKKEYWNHYKHVEK